jgi:hypothetical protein
MKAIICRFRSWTYQGKHFWIVILPLLISIFAPAILCKYKWGLDVYRVFGIFIEISGLFTVVASLSRESMKYNHPGYFKSLLGWISEIRYILGPRNMTIVGSCRAELGMFCGKIRAKSIHKFNNIEEKVNYLINIVSEIEDSINNTNDRIDTVKSELNAKIESVSSSITKEISIIHDDLKDKATIDYNLLVAGALLTIIGMIITNLPDRYFQFVFPY